MQDLAASLPAQLLGDVTNKIVIDLCAAPGGKTMQLAAAGAHVTAVDISEPRLQRLKENLERHKFKGDHHHGQCAGMAADDFGRCRAD